MKTFTGLIDNDQFHPGELEKEAGKCNEEFSPPSLLTMSAERQKPCGEIEQELKSLRDLVVSLAQKNGNSASLLLSEGHSSSHHCG